MKTASSISENCPFLGSVNFVCDASHLPIVALCFCHSHVLLLSVLKLGAALWFPFSSAHQATSGFTFAIYDNFRL
jgi:hypothetical protein